MKLSGFVIAKSRKNNGYCVIVFELKRRKFLRLISSSIDRKDGELLDSECRYEDASEVKVKDKVNFHILDVPTNDSLQKENVFLFALTPFEKLSKIDKFEFAKNIKDYIYKGNYIFGNTSNKISDVSHIRESFVLVKVYGLHFYRYDDRFGNPKCRAKFIYNGKNYLNIYVTICKNSVDDLKKYENKRYDKAVIGLSLGHKYDDGYYYKFLCTFIGGE